MALAGCEYFPTQENIAKQAVRELLIDPSSGKFDHVFKGKAEGSVCGRVNAKNRMGAYSGKSAWFFEPVGGERFAEDLRDLRRIGTGRMGGATIVPDLPTDSDFRMYYHSIGSTNERRDMYMELRQKCDAPKIWEAVCGTSLTSNLNRFCSLMGSPKEFVTALRTEFEH